MVSKAVKRRHPKGLDAKGGGSWSRQKHARAQDAELAIADLKVG